MATRKRTDLRSKDVPAKKSLSKNQRTAFAQALFCSNNRMHALRRSVLFRPLIIHRPGMFFPGPVDDLSALPSLQSLRTLPFRSNLFFSSRSVTTIVPMITAHCSVHTIPPTFPTQLFPFPKTHAKTITVTGIITSPLTYQSFPQQRCAYFQVSLFFMDIAVRYPYIALISFGGFF